MVIMGLKFLDKYAVDGRHYDFNSAMNDTITNPSTNAHDLYEVSDTMRLMKDKLTDDHITKFTQRRGVKDTTRGSSAYLWMFSEPKFRNHQGFRNVVAKNPDSMVEAITRGFYDDHEVEQLLKHKNIHVTYSAATRLNRDKPTQSGFSTEVRNPHLERILKEKNNGEMPAGIFHHVIGVYDHNGNADVRGWVGIKDHYGGSLITSFHIDPRHEHDGFDDKLIQNTYYRKGTTTVHVKHDDFKMAKFYKRHGFEKTVPEVEGHDTYVKQTDNS